MIKSTRVKYKEWDGYFRYKWFTKYVADNGKSVCTVSGKIVSPDEGNKLYKELKATKKEFSSEVEITLENDSEIIKYLKSQIDPYTCYIDNYKQQQEAEIRNDEIRKILTCFKTVCEASC